MQLSSPCPVGAPTTVRSDVPDTLWAECTNVLTSCVYPFLHPMTVLDNDKEYQSNITSSKPKNNKGTKIVRIRENKKEAKKGTRELRKMFKYN